MQDLKIARFFLKLPQWHQSVISSQTYRMKIEGNKIKIIEDREWRSSVAGRPQTSILLVGSRVSGIQKLEIGVASQTLQSSITVSIAPGPLDLARSMIVPIGGTRFVAGEQLNFELQGRDRLGNSLKLLDTFQVLQLKLLPLLSLLLKLLYVLWSQKILKRFKSFKRSSGD